MIAAAWFSGWLCVALVAVLAMVSPSYAAESLPGGGYVVVLVDTSEVVVVDRVSKTIVGTVPVPGATVGPNADLAAGQDGVVYVLAGDRISAVDVGSMMVTRSYTAPSVTEFSGLAVSPAGDRIYAVSSGAAGSYIVTTFDPFTGDLVATVESQGKVVSGPRQLAADDGAMYVVSGKQIDVIEKDGLVVAAHIALSNAIGGIAIDAPRQRLYATTMDGPISGVSTSTRQIVSAVQPSREILFPKPITVSVDGSELFTGADTVGGIQAIRSGAEGEGWLAFRWPIGMPAEDAVTGDVWVPLIGSDNLAVIDDWREPSGITMPANVLAVGMINVLTSAPSVAALNAGDGHVGVEFTPGGPTTAPVHGYKVVATNVTNDTTGTGAGVTSPVTVSGLTNGDTYTFTVTGVDAAGQPITETSPSSPRINVGVAARFNVSHPLPIGSLTTQAFEYTVPVLGAPQPTVWLDPGTPLPSWLEFDEATATFSGTPPADAVGEYHFFLQTTNSVGADNLDVFLNVTALPAPEPTQPDPDPTSPPLPSTAPIQNPSSSGRLAATGSNLAAPVIASILGVAILAVGAAFVYQSRQRSQRRTK